MAETLLRVENLTMHYTTRAGEVSAVDDVSFTLDKGASMGLVGESGCGKTSIAATILKLLPENAEIQGGHIYLDGSDLAAMSENDIRKIRWRRISMVFQAAMNSLNPVYKVGDQIIEALETHLPQLSAQDARKRVEDLFSLVGLDPKLADQYPHEFSGGMRQRAMIAMALSCEPQLLIADEPTTALDVTIQAQIIDLVVRLQEELGMAVMWITHDLGVVAEMAHKINVMYAGFIIERGSAHDIFKRTRHPYTLGLLGSLPRIDEAPGTKLISIPGLPPDLLALSEGCPFFVRCTYRIDRCLKEMPPLEETDSKNHFSACWRWEHIAGREAG